MANAKNIEEYVVEKVIDYMESSHEDYVLLKHIFQDQYLRCKLCNTIVVPVPNDINDERYKNLWICPCDFCYIGENCDVYEDTRHRAPRRALGDVPCDIVYCKGCVSKHGYNSLFIRYKFIDKEIVLNADFHDTNEYKMRYDVMDLLTRKMTYFNMCKKCGQEIEMIRNTISQ